MMTARATQRSGGPAAFAVRLAVMLFIICLSWPALAQNFPALTGRVVDGANILDAASEISLDQKLKTHEDRTSDQIVIATITSLEGYDIADYANRLFRHWKLGQAKTNNGVLILVAPNERKIRIEVGYGLEGSLTDAVSRVIIAGAIAPKFKQNDYAGGLQAGTDAIIGTLTGDDEWQQRAKLRNVDAGDPVWPVILFIVVVILVFFILPAFFGPRHGGGKAHRTRNGRWVVVPTSTGWGGGGGGFSSGGGGGFGGGFSGGGGSSGGGGASGDW